MIRNTLRNWVVFIFSEQKPYKNNFKHIIAFFITLFAGYKINVTIHKK